MLSTALPNVEVVYQHGTVMPMLSMARCSSCTDLHDGTGAWTKIRSCHTLKTACGRGWIDDETR